MPDRWMETATDAVVVRHDARDARDAERLIGDLTALAIICQQRLALPPPEPHAPTTVVLHGTTRALFAAHPALAMAAALTSRANRSLVVGAAANGVAHVLSPRKLRAHAVGGGPEEREFLRLAPSAALAQAMVGRGAARLRRPAALLGRNAWIVWGAGQHLSGQTDHVHGLIRRHLRKAERASFPPGRRDAVLLGGSVFDVIARERGTNAVLALLADPDEALMTRALGDHGDGHGSGAWRAHLARVAEGAER